MKTILLWLLMAGILPVAAQNTCSDAIEVLDGQTTSTIHSNAEDVWYKFTPLSHVRVTISRVDLTSLETYVLVYNECETINYIAFNDKISNPLNSHVTFEGKAGITYYIRWKYNSTLLNTPYKWNLSTSDPVSGDFCSIALEASEGNNQCIYRDGLANWFVYTAKSNYYLILSSDASTAHESKCYVTSACGVYEYEKHTFTEGGSTSYAVKAVAGRKYYIRWEADEAQDSYNWNLKEETIAKGDICTLPLLAADGTNQANHTDGFSQWYTYTAQRDGTIVVSSMNLTTENTNVAVYSDCSPHNLLRENDDSNSTTQSNLTFTAKAGDNYRIEWKSPVSHSTYNWTLHETTSTQGNECSTALRAVSGTNRSVHANGNDQWFVFTPQRDGLVTISSCQTTGTITQLKVFSDCTGTEIGTLTNCGTGQQTYTFKALVDQSYYIQWGYPNADEAYNWEIELLPDPEGESCGSPIMIYKGVITTAPEKESLWFSFISQERANVTITCQSNISASIKVLKNCSSSVLAQSDNVFSSPIHFEIAEGDAMLINWDGISSDFTWEIKSDMILSTSNKQSEMISLSPNPTQGNFTLSGIPSQGASIKIFALDGTMVYSDQTSNSPDSVVPGEFLPKGIYLVLVITNERTSKFKLLKQ